MKVTESKVYKKDLNNENDNNQNDNIDQSLISTFKKGSYLSKRGYVLRREQLTKDELIYLKKTLWGKPLVDSKFTVGNFNTKDTNFPVYIETKNKIYIPKIFGIKRYGFPESEHITYYGGNSNDNKNDNCNWDDSIQFNGELYDVQKEAVSSLLTELKNGTGGGILSLSTGFGKCMAKDTPILMYDGSIKMIQDIKEGELLMGDDSTPRKVLNLSRGRDLMYDIIPAKGEKYTVNQEHILCLQITRKPYIYKLKNNWIIKWFENNNYNTKSFNLDKKEKAIEFMKNVKQQNIMEISVKEYIKLPKHIKHILKGYKVPIEFLEKEVPINPYIIGLHLANSNNSNKGHVVDLHLINNKHIPDIYKCNSREVRLKLLAGLIDSSGYLCNDKCTFQFTHKSEKLIDDVIYLCRSLGFGCHKIKEINNIYKKNQYNMISISGNTYQIPTLSPSNKAKPRKQKKDVLKTGITVKEIGYDNYYGFEIDGNSRYVLGDFTVTHNTFCAIYALSQLRTKAIVIVNKISLLKQWESEIKRFLPNASVGILQGQKNIDIYDKHIVLAMLQSLAKVDYPQEFFNDIGVTVVDEAHNVPSKVFSQVLMKTCSKYTIGLSATPKRSDGCEYIIKWFLGDIVHTSKTERKGLPPIINTITIDSSDYKEVTMLNKLTGLYQVQFTTMLNELVSMFKRNKLIIELIKDCVVTENRKVLVLSDRRQHLVTLKNLLDKDTTITFTYGLFLGQMKINDLEKSKASQVILATYQAFGEGVSEKDLNTLILTTPKKFIGHLKTTKAESGKLEQIVGRIFRKDHTEIPPQIIDLNDNFSVYKNHSKQRLTFYKQHFSIATFKSQCINLDEFNINEININCLQSKVKNKKNKNDLENDVLEKNLSKKFYDQCLLD